MSSIFKAKARRNGNSLAVTITKGVADGLGIKEGDTVLIDIRKVDNKEVETQ